MGKSKSYREGPSWQSNNTGRGTESYSRADIPVKVEGTLMSGSEPSPRGGKSLAQARNRSTSSRGPVKNDGPYGKS